MIEDYERIIKNVMWQNDATDDTTNKMLKLVPIWESVDINTLAAKMFNIMTDEQIDELVISIKENP